MLTDGTISLRAPEPNDIDDMYVWENDASVWTDGCVRAPMSRKALYDYINSYNPDPCAAGQLRLIVELNTTETPIGMIDLFDFDPLNRRAGVGILLDSAHRGKGYGTATLRLLCDYARIHLGLHQLWAIVSRTNQPSLSLFASAGFKSCGSLRSWIRIGESYSDALFYQRLLTT